MSSKVSPRSGLNGLLAFLSAPVVIEQPKTETMARRSAWSCSAHALSRMSMYSIDDAHFYNKLDASFI